MKAKSKPMPSLPSDADAQRFVDTAAEAKPFSADGTALVTVWESRTPPDIHCQ